MLIRQEKKQTLKNMFETLAPKSSSCSDAPIHLPQPLNNLVAHEMIDKHRPRCNCEWNDRWVDRTFCEVTSTRKHRFIPGSRFIRKFVLRTASLGYHNSILSVRLASSLAAKISLHKTCPALYESVAAAASAAGTRPLLPAIAEKRHRFATSPPKARCVSGCSRRRCPLADATVRRATSACAGGVVAAVRCSSEMREWCEVTIPIAAYNFSTRL